MDKNAFDPMAAWQKMVQDWEHQINSWSGKMTETEEFSSVMGQMTKVMMVTQKQASDQMEAFIQSLNMPTKTQLEAMTDRLDAIEDSITQLRIALEKLPQQDAPAARKAEPRRTRVPPPKAGGPSKNDTAG
jgi:polyhydroxyalkanoate synthesis regulator phasin